MFNTRSSKIVANLFFLSVLLIGPYFLLRPFSPNYMSTRLSEIAIMPDINEGRLYTINGRDLTCFGENGQTATCETLIDGKLLQINHQRNQHTAGTCTAIYDGRTLDHCQANYWLGHYQPAITLTDDLGISAERYAQLRQVTPLIQWQEHHWLQARNIAIAAVALLALGWFWVQTRQSTLISTTGRRIAYTLSGTAVTSFLFFITSIFTLLMLSLID